MQRSVDETKTTVDGSGRMFDRIAMRYDLLNRIMSMGLDTLWRRRLVRSLQLPTACCEVLDVATGTADVAIRIARASQQSTIVGLDPSAGMLCEADRKVANLGLSDRVRLVQGDARHMPFEDDQFAASCISFGIRNVSDRVGALHEMCRITAPGGVVAVLELSEPTAGHLSLAARWHVHKIVPMLGAWLSGSSEYRYLQQSIEAFPPPDAFLEMMEAAGINDSNARSMAMGAVQLFTGRA